MLIYLEIIIENKKKHLVAKPEVNDLRLTLSVFALVVFDHK